LPPLETRTISNKIKAYMDALKAGEVEDELGWNLLV
jgi:hypothetical protein